MRWVPALLVWGCSILLGLRARYTLKAREMTISSLLQFLQTLKLQMAYGCAALPDLLQSLSSDDGLAFLPVCCRMMEEGVSFQKAWETAVQTSALPLLPAQTAQLLRLGSLLGTTDLGGQMQILQQVTSFFEEALSDAKRCRAQKASLYSCLGVFAGFLIFIVTV